MTDIVGTVSMTDIVGAVSMTGIVNVTGREGMTGTGTVDSTWPAPTRGAF
ncbi:hypothetical protein [Streptomyces sp. NPDC040750]